MILYRTFRRKALWVGPLLVVSLVVTSCGGIKPYEPRNNREEGPEKGLFTGSEGEFIILRKADEPNTSNEDKKNPDEAKSAAQPQPDSDQREKVEAPKHKEESR
jgi:hypothetical protein